MPPELSLIVPMYNEEGRIAAKLPAILAFLKDKPYAWELIAVEDGSRDRTKEMVLKAFQGVRQARLLSFRENRGKGFAVREGVLASRGRFVAFIDLDLAVPVSAIDRALELLRLGHDGVIGSRLHADSRILRRQPLVRRIGSRVFNALRRRIVPSRFPDSQCGFKAFRGELARKVLAGARIDSFLFDVEWLSLFERSGARLFEMPVDWTDVDGSRFRIGQTFGILRDLAAVRWRDEGAAG